MPIPFQGSLTAVQLFDIARDLFSTDPPVSLSETEVIEILDRVVGLMVCAPSFS